MLSEAKHPEVSTRSFAPLRMTTRHVPVLVDEIVQWIAWRKDGRYVDATLGGGGHAKAILEAAPIATLLGIDQDDEAIAVAKTRLQSCGDRVHFLRGAFGNLREHLATVGWEEVDGIVADLGMSSLALDSASRGFSFKQKGPLDMRMDRRRPLTAAAWIQHSSEEELAEVFWKYGEERHSRRIAGAIVRERHNHPITTTEELATVIRKAMPRSRHQRIDPATRVFQAIRIFINDEVGELERFLDAAPSCLAPRGRFAVISYHSLEDRMVKQTFRSLEGEGYSLPIRRVIRPTEEEIATNPRSRSAKLRILEREVTP